MLYSKLWVKYSAGIDPWETNVFIYWFTLMENLFIAISVISLKLQYFGHDVDKIPFSGLTLGQCDWCGCIGCHILEGSAPPLLDHGVADNTILK